MKKKVQVVQLCDTSTSLKPPGGRSLKCYQLSASCSLKLRIKPEDESKQAMTLSKACGRCIMYYGHLIILTASFVQPFVQSFRTFRICCLFSELLSFVKVT